MPFLRHGSLLPESAQRLPRLPGGTRGRGHHQIGRVRRCQARRGCRVRRQKSAALGGETLDARGVTRRARNSSAGPEVLTEWPRPTGGTTGISGPAACSRPRLGRCERRRILIGLAERCPRSAIGRSQRPFLPLTEKPTKLTFAPLETTRSSRRPRMCVLATLRWRLNGFFLSGGTKSNNR
jgi:hypothetical protein